MPVLRPIDIPDFGVPLAPPPIPPETYARRCRDAYARAGADWFVVYGDREHSANIAFLSGYDPRFEEALLLLGPRERRVLVVGNEGMGYAQTAALPGLEIVLAQTMSLMGQDRLLKPDLGAVIRDAGLAKGATSGSSAGDISSLRSRLAKARASSFPTRSSLSSNASPARARSRTRPRS